jgi:hypothetical protein
MSERIKEQTETWVKSIQLPQETDSYKPVSHGSLIDTLEFKLLEKGLIPYQRKYFTAKNGQELHGDWILKKTDQTIEQLNVGSTTVGISFINSYNKHLKLEIVPGLRVLTCGNGAMSKTAISTFDRKHTGAVNEEFLIFIQNSLEGLDELTNMMNTILNKAKQVQINRKIMSELAGRLFIDKEIITSEQLSILKNEIYKPSFNQFVPENVYSFYNHCTWAARNSHPSEVIDRYTGIHEFITNEFSL